MRKVILHYHLFKNAGTSIDEMLRINFGDQWITKEFEGDTTYKRQQIADWIMEHPNAIAFSTHTAQLPPPRIAGIEILPIIFIRHPIDRIASAYAFERKQGSTSWEAALARNSALAGYIEVRLAMASDWQCRNFHCKNLATMFDDRASSELERAMSAIKELPFIGLVDSYEKSIQRLTLWLQEYYLNIEPIIVSHNVSRNNKITLAERLLEVKSELGEDAYARLECENRDDLIIYENVKLMYQSEIQEVSP